MYRLITITGMMLLALVATLQFARPGLARAESDQVVNWLENAGLVPDMKKSMQARVRNEPQARNWLTVLDGQVASLVYRPWRHGRPSPQIQQHERTIVQMQANQQLLLLAVDDHYRQYGLTDKEGLATALYRVSSTHDFTGKILAGTQSSATILDTGAVALVWTREDRITMIRQNPPPVSLVVPAYCQAVYAGGRAQYELRNYEKALLAYRELYQLNCKIPDIYLDSAQAFLKTDKPEDARRLLHHALDSLLDLMTSAQLEQAGALFLTLKDDQSATNAYDLALQKYRTEQGIN